MGGVVSDFVDDTLGFDPGGGGIFNVVNDVLGDDIADDLLGLDPGGGGIVPLVNTAANIGVSMALGDVAGGLLGGESAILGTTGGASAGSAGAADVAWDAAQLASQGLGEAQIAEVLGASGVSTGASNLAASMAINGLDAATITTQLNNLSANTGLFTQEISDAAFNTADAAQIAKQVGNNPLAIEQNLIAAGIDPLEAATYAQQAVLASGVAPTQGMWDQFSNYLKENPSILNTLGKAAVIGAASQVPQTQVAPIPAYKPADTMPTYSPEYYQQVQQYYNTYLPSTPRDVATPLQEWYSSGYTQPDSVTAKLFSGV